VTSLRIEIGPATTIFALQPGEPVAPTEPASGAGLFVAPIGDEVLTQQLIASDPPRPEELTNAIGVVFDHLDDLLRERPEVAGVPATVTGPVTREIVAVELGYEATLPFTLTRDAAEDVFRTLATESQAERALNPGLRREMVRTVVAGCCVTVAIMRRLQLDEVEVVG
jgi:exopolyphosphatase/guanosine-5'-triphosphate,3'-diphosphate pyrophosphatase